jgi:hypothetical protein
MEVVESCQKRRTALRELNLIEPAKQVQPEQPPEYPIRLTRDQVRRREPSDGSSLFHVG